MKKFVMDLILKDSIYRECRSPVLPIPFSKEDMSEMMRLNGISYTVISDNLLQMVGTDPEKRTLYQFLIVHCCLIAGGEAARNGNHELSNHYFLSAANFAPNSFVIRKNLARSYQHLQLYQDAIDNYEYVVKDPHCEDSTWIYLIECLYALGEIEPVRNIIKILQKNAERTGNGAIISFSMQATSILSNDHAPEGLKALLKEFLNL